MSPIHPAVLEQIVYVQQSLLRSPEFNRRAQQLREVELQALLRGPERRLSPIERWLRDAGKLLSLRRPRVPLLGSR